MDLSDARTKNDEWRTLSSVGFTAVNFHVRGRTGRQLYSNPRLKALMPCESIFY